MNPNEAFGSFCSERLSSMVRRGLALKVAAGGTPGCAPVGYRNARNEKLQATVVPDPTTAPLVAEAFRLVAEEGSSCRQTLKEVQARGLTSRSGKPLTPSAMWVVLTNPYYCGMIRYGGAVVPGMHRPLVTRECFDLVQEHLASRRYEPLFEDRSVYAN